MLDRLLAGAGQCLDRTELRRPVLRSLLTLLLFLPAAGLLVLVAIATARRLTFPLALEWLEDSQIYHAQQLLQGLPLYPVETSGFLPHPYPPVHPMLLAAAGAAFGLDYLPARVLSVVAWVLAAVVVMVQVGRHWPAGSTRAAAVAAAAGSVAATYGMVQGWYDTARVDSVALAFMVLSAAPLTSRRLRGWHLVASATLATAAIYTKQTNVFFAVAICVVVARSDLKRGLLLAGIMAALSTVTLVTLEVVTRGGFMVWLLNTRHHGLRATGLLLAVGKLLAWAPFLALLPVLLRRHPGRLSLQTALWVALLIAAVPAGALPYAKPGGWSNGLIPVLFLAGPVTLILAGDLARTCGALARRRLTTAVVLLQAVYLSCCLFDPRHASPDAQGRRLADALNRSVAALDGGVVCPLYPFLPLRNGHTTPQAGWLSHTDAALARMRGVTPASYAGWLVRVRPRWLLLAGETEEAEADLRRLIRGHYVFERQLDAPRWEGLWLTNPLPRRLYRLAPAAAAANERASGECGASGE